MSVSPSVATQVSCLPVGKGADHGRFGGWLREQLNRQGYGERGGPSRFAREADINLSILSRALNEGRVPEIDALRAMGRVLGHTLGEMLVVAGVATAEELPIRPSAAAPGTTVLPDALRDLRASAALEGKTMGELLVTSGLATEEELIVPPTLPPDPIIAEIEASGMSEETKTNIIRMHLDNRARRFEDARLEREQKKKRPGS